MKRVSFVVALLTLFIAWVPGSAQTGITGTWQVEGVGSPFPWKTVLRAEGTNLSGAVSLSSINFAAEISEGKIEGNTVTFKFVDRGRRITLTGEVNDNEIVFKWDLQVQDGGRPPADDDGLFGPSAPSQFTVKRVQNSVDVVSTTADRIRRAPAVGFDRILHADQEPQNWLTYSGSLAGTRYSPLNQITTNNVKDLSMAWIWQAQRGGWFEATPLVVEGVLYTVQTPNDVVALDASTGQVLWTYPYTPSGYFNGYKVNRGLAISGNTLFIGTLDAHLLAINAFTGKLIWNIAVADATDPSCKGNTCYSITHAPLVIKDNVIVGTAGGDTNPGVGIRGVIAAFAVTTGKEVWRFSTIPAPGEPGNETWSGDSWKTGGAAVWNTGSYDPDLNLTYWGTGNPSPNEDPNSRLGDNLYSDSVVALDADTGKLRWYYQFTPHDDMDWDSTQIPVLTDIEWQGRPRKVMLFANRNGLMYVLDRTNGQFLLGKPFVGVNWLTGFDEKGRPLRAPKTTITPVMPRGEGTNWYPPSFSLKTGLFYIPSWEEGTNPLFKEPTGPIYSAIRAFDPQTGEKKWEFKRDNAIFKSGVLTTASDLLFTGVLGQGAAGRRVDGDFYALDARTGQLLWQLPLPGSVQSGPISYAVGSKQFIAVAAGNTLFAFALRP